MTGTHLSQQVYALLTYIQATQTQTLLEQSTMAKSKAKDKKKVPKGQNLPGKVTMLLVVSGIYTWSVGECYARGVTPNLIFHCNIYIF